jgi:hypothetical protein
MNGHERGHGSQKGPEDKNESAGEDQQHSTALNLLYVKSHYFLIEKYKDSRLVDITLVRKKVLQFVRFEVFTAMTMKNGVFWDVTPCVSC